MRATIVLNHRAGRALRRESVEIRVRDVLWCSGDFAAGDPVYVTFCGVDGGQYAVAAGIAQLPQAQLRERLPALSAAGGAMLSTQDDTLVIAREDVRLLWS